MRYHRILICVVAIAAFAAIIGCGPRGPEAVARGFVGAMKAGDMEQAATFWDYITAARKKNENWDDIPKGQRKLIIKELQDDRATELEYWRRYFDPETTVVEVNVTGDTAQAILRGGDAGVVEMIKINEKWYVTGLRP